MVCTFRNSGHRLDFLLMDVLGPLLGFSCAASPGVVLGGTVLFGGWYSETSGIPRTGLKEKVTKIELAITFLNGLLQKEFPNSDLP